MVKRDTGSESLPESWTDRLARYAEDDAAVASDVGGVPQLSLRGGTFRMGDDVLDGPLSVVIVGATRENVYYTKAFDPESPSNPDCFAIAKKDVDLAPPSDLATKESESCAECWANAWGSSPREGSRGKACGNHVRLLLLAMPNGPLRAKNVADLQVARLRVPTTSLSNFSRYTQGIAKQLLRPLFTVVTQLDLEDDDKNQFVLTFDGAEPINNEEVLDALEKRMKELEPTLMAAPATGSGDEDDEKKKRGGRKSPVRKKKVAKKTAKKKARRRGF